MDDTSLQEVRAELAVLRASHAALERRVRGRGHTRRRGARIVGLLVVALTMALAPLGLLASDRFTDVPPQTQYSHHDDINAIADAGITVGCGGDPTTYCPTADVTRGEMASFLARTAGLGTNPPVANAKTLAGYAPNGLVRSAVSVPGNPPTVINDGVYDPNNPAAARFQIVGGVDLYSPGPGFIVVTSTVGIRADGGSVVVRLSNGPRREVFSPVLRADIPAGGHYVTLSPTFVFPVGQQPTGSLIRLEAAVIGDPAAVNAVAETLMATAIFVPFDGLGQPSTKTP